MQQAVDSTTGELLQSTAMMTRFEAQICLSEIKGHGYAMRDKLLTLYEREGWRALGYETWRACATAEFPRWSQSYLYYLLKAARIEHGLKEARDIRPEFSTLVEIEDLPETHIRALTPLRDPLEQLTALRMAEDAAKLVVPSGQVTASMIDKAVSTVQEMKATGGKVDVDGKMLAATASVIAKHHESVQTHIEAANEKRGVGDGTVAIILGHSACRITGVMPNGDVMISFDDPADAVKLKQMWFSKAGQNLSLKLTQKTKG